MPNCVPNSLTIQADVGSLCDSGGDESIPACGQPPNDDVVMPAPPLEAAELSDVTRRAIADTGTAYNLISAAAADQMPESVVDVPPIKFSTANDRVMASQALYTKLKWMGNQKFHFHVLGLA